MKIINACRRLIVKANDDVPFAQSSIPCRAVTLERHNEDSALNGKLIVAHDSARKRNILSGQPYVTATHFTIANQAAGNELGSVDRSSKGDSLGRQNHRRVDANDFSSR